MASPDRFNDRRLREESLKAFVKALHTDRMVAVTGAMSTRALGYPSWTEFIKAYAIVARDFVQEMLFERAAEPDLEHSTTGDLLASLHERADTLANLPDDRPDMPKPDPDLRVALWALHESFRTLDTQMRQVRAGLVVNTVYQEPALKRFEKRVARIFKSRTLGPGPLTKAPGEAAIRPLIESLGLKRIATLNYDLELERAFMLRGDERKTVTKRDTEISASLCAGAESDRTRPELFAAKATRALENLSSVSHFFGKRETGKPIVAVHRNRLSRTMTNGMHVESDIVDRERPDRLFEFAVGSAETDRHILHLHGRADVPESMVANIRQYDRLYRLDDLYRDPFDHSLRVLVGGNPILFVGVGMTEAELNNTLQYFVSNVPVRRPAPTFVVWNTLHITGDRARYMEELRLDFRTRLGVHLLFDADIVQPGDDQWLKDLCEPPIDNARMLQALAMMLAKLPALVSRVDKRIKRKDKWRSAARRFRQPGPHRILGAARVGELVADNPGRINVGALRTGRTPGKAGGKTDAAPSRLVFATAEPGYGRGELAEHLVAMKGRDKVVIGDIPVKLPKVDRRLLVHAGFSYDSDATLNSIAEFLISRPRAFGWFSSSEKHAPPKMICREQRFADKSLFKEEALIIINGVDRFFGSDGKPLSAELDHMLRCAEGGKVTFLLLGTDRLNHYCDALGGTLQNLAPGAIVGDAGEGVDEALLQSIPEEYCARTTQLEQLGKEGKLGSRYLDFLAGKFRKATLRERAKLIAEKPERLDVKLAATDISDSAAAHIDRALNVDRNALNRAFFQAYLSPTLLQALDVHCPEAFEVLRTMCFIGAPIEAVVLLHAPKVRAILAETLEAGTGMRPRHEIADRLNEVVDSLHDLGLLIEIDPYYTRKDDKGKVIPDPGPGAPGQSVHPQGLWRRFSLHRALATYLRDRHGAPINDAKLATAFNMSLFMSEPSENYVPESDFHDELGDLVDSLIGGWHDLRGFYSASSSALPAVADRDRYSEALAGLYIHPDDEQRAWKTLEDRSGREAATCLRAALSLVRGYYSTGALLKFDHDDGLSGAERDGALTEHAQRLDRLITGFGDISVAREVVGKMFRDSQRDEDGIRFLGPDPFYADDLVWLHNERGVVALAQGHMFDAREAFSAADAVNGKHLEQGYRGHNWRRIALNRVATMIERGSLKPAERLIEQIDATINDPQWLGGKQQTSQEGTRVEAVRALFAQGKEPPIWGNRQFLREELLIVAMTTSYRGLVAHIQGRFHDSKEALSSGTNMLRRLGELRAYAHFQRHYASLYSFVGNRAQALVEIDYAINAAQSAKQMDILHRSRVVRANLWRHTSNDLTLRRDALQDIKDALKYAALSDCYRVRIEASASLARHMRKGGDYDTALSYASDALTIASRYGHSLQKTLLRIEIGQIMIARGDPLSGDALLDQAVAIGTGKGYHQALEHVRRARSALAANPALPHRTDIHVTR